MCSIFKLFAFIFFIVYAASIEDHYLAPLATTQEWESYLFNNKEYIIQNMNMNWENADIMCRGYHNASLVIIDSKDKAEFMAETLAESQFSLETVWVGARRSPDDPNEYVWWDGTPLYINIMYSPDLPDEGGGFPMWLNRTVPASSGSSDCVALERIHHDTPVFLNLPCEMQRAFICEREANPYHRVVQLKSVRCSTGLYHVFDGSMNWHQAAAYCLLKKMSLANIPTVKCMKKIGKTMVKMRPSIENAWVGARGRSGKWTWLDTGTNLFTPTSFLDVQPSLWPPMRRRSSKKQNGCLQIDKHVSRPPVFIESRCERKMKFICYEGPPPRNDSLRSSDKAYNYMLVRQKLTWQGAFENCKNNNATLANVHNNEMLMQLLLVMSENVNQPINHVWLSGRLNVTRDLKTDAVSYSWYNPSSGKRIVDPKNYVDGIYMAPWLDDEFSSEAPCLNLDRKDHTQALLYGLPCDILQYSICVNEIPSKSATLRTETTTEPVTEDDRSSYIK